MQRTLKSIRQDIQAQRVDTNLITDLECRKRGITVDLLFAQAALQSKDPAALIKAYQRLIDLYFHASPRRQAEVRQLLLELAEQCDHELAGFMKCERKHLSDALATACRKTPDRRIDLLLKAFYIGSTQQRCNPADDVLNAGQEIKHHAHNHLNRTTVNGTYEIHFLKDYSSYTPLLAPPMARKLGGGYFLALDGYGCVVDPGHHFLDNFITHRHKIADIDGIIITHFHDDHYADFPALMSLLHQVNALRDKIGKEPRHLDLFLDSTTACVFKPLINFADKELVKTTVLHVGEQPSLSHSRVRLTPLPTQHDILGEETGIGLLFDWNMQAEGEMVHAGMVITGDTAWSPAVEQASAQMTNDASLRDIDGLLLVPHISTVYPEEAYGTLTHASRKRQYYSKHLCLHGLCRAIETWRPANIVLSEIGEELAQSIELIASMVKHAYGIDCSYSRNGRCFMFSPRNRQWQKTGG